MAVNISPDNFNQRIALEHEMNCSNAGTSAVGLPDYEPKSMITFCIVTPSYNQAHFIQETIDSVRSQQGNFAVRYCVMDGGSNDGTKELLKKLPQATHRVSEKDRGQTDAINKGIQHFQGMKDLDPDQTIFAYINSDDYYLPGVFQNVVERFSADPACNWLVGDAVIIDARGKEIQQPVRLYKRVWRQLFSRFVLTVLNPLPQPSTFIRWSAVQRVGLFNEDLRYVMDYEYWLRLYQAGYQPTMMNTAFSAFRIHGDSKGGSQYVKQFAQELDIARHYTKNPLAIWLHQLHNWAIIQSYKVLK